MTSRLASFVSVPVLALLGLSLRTEAAAQQGRELPVTPDKPYTLHVYEDLIQLPSFVLNPLYGTSKGLQARDFRLRLDSGPVFHPLHVRLQGEDQMALAILLDNAGQMGPDLQRELDSYAAGMPAEMFKPRDALSLVAASCSRVLSFTMPQASVSSLRKAVTTLLHGASQTGDCTARVPLWDSVATVAMRMHDAPGRRVLLVISDGLDTGSSNTWKRTREYASHYGITVVGVRLHALSPASMPLKAHSLLDTQEDPFSMLCSGTGGILLDAELESVWLQVRRIVDLLRERYILDFQRPVNGGAGLHLIDITVKDKKAIVRISGIGVPLRDSNLMADPGTVPNDTSQAPIVGDRRILPQPR